MANEPTINLALVGEMPENPVRGTIYMSPDTSGNFVKVGVDGSVRTIFDGSIYALRRDLPWTFGEGENSAVLKNTNSYATGTGAVAHGYDTSAHGDYSHAEGHYTDASGNYSHAEGIHAKASGRYSHAEGSGTNASGSYSHAEGDSASAIGDYSHAEGNCAIASGEYSHAEGVDTIASGEYSHAEGDSTIAYGSHSHVEGYGSSEPLSFMISGAANAITYTTNIAHDLKVYDILEYNGIIAVVIFNNNNKKFTVDRTLSDVQLTNVSGLKRISGISYGNYSHAEGSSATASGLSSHAEGQSTTASGQCSHAEGYITTASGQCSHAEGYTAKASGNYSHAEGINAVASEIYSHAEGVGTTTSGSGSHAEGNGTRASGVCSHAEGFSTKASGNNSHAEGQNTTASGNYSHAEGQSTTASGQCSHAEGYITTASGQCSHAEGYTAKASGNYSHAEGSSATASGLSSHAEGCGTVATNNNEHAQGLYNYSNQGTLFSIGIGDNNDARKNIIEVNSKKLYINKVGGYKGTTINSSMNALDTVLDMPGFLDPEYDYIFNGGTIPEPSRPPRPVIVPDDIHNYWIYVDSYKSAMAELAEDQGYDSIQSYMDAFFEDPDNTMSLGHRFKYNEDITFDGSTYQLWYQDRGIGETYAILKNDSLQTMIDNSKETELDNEYTPFISILDSDMNTIYDKGQMSDFWKIYKHSLVLVRPVDSVTSDIRDYYLYTNDLGDESGFLRWTEKCGYDDIDSYLDDLLDNPEQFYTNAYYYDSDIEFDGETHQLWLEYNSDGMPMLLKSDTPEYMANHSIEADYHNKYCPFIAMLTDDMNHIRYDDNIINMAERYRLLCFRER